MSYVAFVRRWESRRLFAASILPAWEQCCLGSGPTMRQSDMLCRDDFPNMAFVLTCATVRLCTVLVRNSFGIACKRCITKTGVRFVLFCFFRKDKQKLVCTREERQKCFLYATRTSNRQDNNPGSYEFSPTRFNCLCSLLSRLTCSSWLCDQQAGARLKAVLVSSCRQY